MKPLSNNPFDFMWFGVDLEGIHEINATYGGFSLENMPDVPQKYKNPDFSWLHPDKAKNVKVNPDWSKKLNTCISTLPAHLQDKVDPALKFFMTHTQLHDFVPSCTACYFHLLDKVVPFERLGQKGYLLQFYRDQQDCVLWYYYINEQGESCILASTFAVENYNLENIKDDALKHNLLYTCPDFITFIYYTWVENLAWFSAEEGEGEDFHEEAVKEFIKNYKQKQNKS
jgi:hypothetical protein